MFKRNCDIAQYHDIAGDRVWRNITQYHKMAVSSLISGRFGLFFKNRSEFPKDFIGLIRLLKFRFKMAEQCHHLENPLNGSISLNTMYWSDWLSFFLKCSEFSQELTFLTQMCDILRDLTRKLDRARSRIRLFWKIKKSVQLCQKHFLRMLSSKFMFGMGNGGCGRYVFFGIRLFSFYLP